MPKFFTSPSQKLGKEAEDAVAEYLKNKGFTIVEQNYTRKCGEIDIIAYEPAVVSRGTSQGGGITHFIEVKAVTRETFEGGVEPRDGEFRPEDNMSSSKVRKFKTTLQVYLMSVRNEENKSKRHQLPYKRHTESQIKWQTDLFVVYIEKHNHRMIIKPIWNIIL